ncbi:MAG: hypothetical protein WBA93_07210 [Microcoleaceae cyanobacterium]
MLIAEHYGCTTTLNLIEGEWHQITTDKIAGRMFEDEYDLALGS